jgi:cell wall-associated NlpC family hydrolase
MAFEQGPMYRKSLKTVLMLTLICGLMMEAACTNNSTNSPPLKGKSSASSQSAKQQGGTKLLNTGKLVQPNQSKSLSQNQGQNQAKLPIVTQNAVQYVNGKALTDLLNFQSVWNPDTSTFLIGDRDVSFALTMNSRSARKESNTIHLQSPPIIINQKAYIPLSAIADLFQQDMSYSVSGNELVVHATQRDLIYSPNDTVAETAHDQLLNFADDPNDPNKDITGSTSGASDHAAMTEIDDGESVSVALRHINIPNLIYKAKQYLGVKYIFGASPYNQSGGFDCSSFTQYIFGKFGVGLRRTARDQANQGDTIGRNDLRIGDLVFFSVPGRFRSNNTPGHVGIYMGNNQMINANNQPQLGVQITDINKAYWKRVFLFAKRVAY